METYEKVTLLIKKNHSYFCMKKIFNMYVVWLRVSLRDPTKLIIYKVEEVLENINSKI